MFSIFGKILSFARWFFVLAYVIALFAIGVKLYPLLKDCWTCDVFSTMYDVFGKISMETFSYFQQYVLIIVSVCLALWIVYKTYEALSPTIDSMLYPDAPKFNPDFIKNIYKKIFLTMAVLGLFIFNDPRNIFSNTFEITLDFGSSIGRELVHKKIIKPELIPSECQNQSSELTYKEDSVLSENTKNNMVCLMHEVNILRHDYMDLGITMFEYGLKPMIATAVAYVATRVAFFAGGIFIKKFGTKGWIKKMNKKLDKLTDRLTNSTDDKNKRKIQKSINDLKKKLEQEASSGKTTKKMEKRGEVVGGTVGKVAGIGVVAGIIAMSEDVRIGLSGICLLIGLTIMNMFFGFIIVEYMLFLGITIILFPVLAVCYIFKDVSGLGGFATKGLSDTFSFALRLIFTCLAMVICSEINDWILGGMFANASTGNITTPQTAIALLKAGDIAGFNDAMGSSWYLAYVLLALYFDFVILNHAPKIAGWFGATVSDSSLVGPLKSLGKSSLSTVTSVSREIKHYTKYGNTKDMIKGRRIDNTMTYLSGKVGGGVNWLRGKFSKKTGGGNG